MPKYELFTTGEVPDLPSLRSYVGYSKAVSVSDATTGGLFFHDETDSSTVDDDENTVVDYKGRRWKKLGAWNVSFLQSGTGAVRRNAQNKMREIVSAKDFGAVGDGVTDDTAALTAFFAHIEANDVASAVCDGTFKITSGLVYGASAAAETLHISGNATFVAGGAIDTMLHFNRAPSLVWDGKIVVTGTGGTSYASRTCRVGVKYGGSFVSSRMKVTGGITATNFYDTGVSCRTLTTLDDLGSIQATQCGSNSVNYLGGNWSAPVNSGSASSTSQRTVVTVDQLPPETLDSPILVNINGEVYFVYSVDRVGNTLTVFPWVDSALVSGTFKYIFGCGLYIDGSDGNVINADQVDVSHCGIGLWSAALYGPTISRLVAQVCAVGYAFGANPSSSHIGFTINGLYSETNDFDVVKVTGSTGAHGGVIFSPYETQFSKFTDVAAPRNASNVRLANQGTSQSMAVIRGGRLYEAVTFGKNGAEAASTLGLQMDAGPQAFVYRRDSWTIALQNVNADVNRLFGYGFHTLTFISSTASSGTPTGSFTFTPPAGYTVNGGASAVFSGFSKPPIFAVYWVTSGTDIEVRHVNPGPVEGMSSDKGDAAATISGTSDTTSIWNTPLTADRAVTLSTTGAYDGMRKRIVRTATATGAFNLNVGTGPLKALAAGQWCEVEYDGAAWMLTAFGSL